VEIERHAVDGLGDTVAGTELHLQLIDLEQQAVDRLPLALSIKDLDISVTAGSD